MPILEEPEFVDSLPISPGDSSEQRDAEAVMIAEYSRVRGVALTPRRFTLDKGVIVQVDGAAADDSLLCEAYAHQGPLKGGQTDKVVMDAFKLLFLARQASGAELVLLFSDADAARTFRPGSKSWVAKAVEAFGVKVEVVAVPTTTRDQVRKAQVRQFR